MNKTTGVQVKKPPTKAEIVKSLIKDEAKKLSPKILAFQNKIDRIIIAFLFSIILILGTIIFIIVISNMKREKELINSHYYIYSMISNNSAITTSERKLKFQMKVIGLMKELKTNLTDIEIIDYTNYIFDKSEEYNWDPYLSISFAWVESGFNKNITGSCDDRGLYQFLPTTARRIAGDSYYTRIEYNPLDATKLWFKYFKYLIDYFEGNIEYAILAYNVGERGVIKNTGIKKKNDKWDFKSGDLNKARKFYYFDKKQKLSYDQKILKFMQFSRTYGTRKEIKLDEINF